MRGWPLLLLLLVASVAPVRADEDTFRWFPPRLQGGGIVAVPKVYYSGENELGLGLELVRPFRSPFADETAADSEIRVKGRLHLSGHGKAEVEATNYFGAGRWYAKGKVGYDALALRFWGIGSDTPSEAEEVYRPQDVTAYVELFRNVFAHLNLGVRAEWQDYKYVETEEGGLLDTQAYPGIAEDDLFGGGVVLEWDGRDHRYAPRHGVYAQTFHMWFGGRDSDFSFRNAYADVRAYFDMGSDNVLALQAFTYALYGDAPIWRYAALGGRAHSRGYRLGRYLERRMAAIQAEWRRPIYDRIEGVAFAGLANVAGRFNSYKLSNSRPTLGGGLRVLLRERRDVMVRADLAFGEDSLRAYFSFGHAF